jgi:hypothetical protein
LSGFSNKYLGAEEIQKFEKEFAKNVKLLEIMENIIMVRYL